VRLCLITDIEVLNQLFNWNLLGNEIQAERVLSYQVDFFSLASAKMQDITPPYYWNPIVINDMLFMGKVAFRKHREKNEISNYEILILEKPIKL
jgi:hypothetical protein